MKRRYRSLLIAVAVLLGSGLVAVSISAASIWAFGSRTELVEADAAIVLGAAVWEDKPSPIFRERINHGIWLYRKGYVRKLIFTGGVGNKGHVAEGIAARTYALDQAVPGGDILVDAQSLSTRGNLVNALRLARRHDIRSFLIVSDPPHMKRAMAIADHLGMRAYSSPTPTTRIRSWHIQLDFVLREVYKYNKYQLGRLFD